MQHVIVTATAEGVVTVPDPIHVYRDDQFIRFGLGPATAWEGANPITFSENWPGGPANLDVNDTYIAYVNNPLAENGEAEKYGVTFKVVHVPTGTRFRHDPEVVNEPRP
jgi:hypothetical protein